jgi:ubiquinone/menaquinone biosynthesis C-methylase UbiE
MSSIHPIASAGFSRAADAYERGRPDYPEAAVEWLVRKLDLRPGVTVVDLAAGTGKLTRALLPSGATVVAVEPVAEMRALIEGAEAVDGRADAMPFPEAWADAITVAQAFHWFANEASVSEIARVLTPSGALALIWNSRVDDHPVQAVIDELTAELATEVTTLYDDAWRGPIEASRQFGPLEEARFDHAQELDEQGVVDRVLSTSYVATAPQERQREIEARLREVVGGETVRLPYVTMAFVTRKTWQSAPPG